MPCLETYPYLLWASLMLLALVIVCFNSTGPHRRVTMISALATPPFTAFFGCIPGYWTPKRIVAWVVSPEDFIFAVAAGGLSWSLAGFLWRCRLTLAFQARTSAWRLAIVLLSAVPSLVAAMLLKVRPMTATLLPVGFVVALILGIRRDLWRLALAGMLGYALVHAAMLVAAFVITPGFAHAWIATDLWGPTVWRIPLDEIVWSAAFGAAWPLFVAYILDVRLMGGEPDSNASLTSATD